VTLTWDPSPDKDVAGYRVYYADMTGRKAGKAKSLDVVRTTRVSAWNLIAGHLYYISLTALNSAGRESTPSNLVTFVAPTRK
jgi:hypothetical protein